jgi:glycosyltransferase involved in cell wall biosynthesis
MAPIVWRLSDMWPMTGHCVYAGACERWRRGCGACPDLRRYPSIPFDTTALLWRIKRGVYAKARPAIVAPSRWIRDLALASPLFAGCGIHHIATGVDTGTYRPISRSAAREILGLPAQGDLLLFTAHVVDDDERKGSLAAIEALNRVPPRDDLSVVLLGMGGASWAGKLRHPTIPLGFIRDQRLLAAAYAAIDLIIVTSTVDNLPNSILEAMACGIPAIAFAAGGIGEAVIAGETGFLAPPGDVARLAEGIMQLLADKNERDRLSRGAVERIREVFAAEREAKEFLALYERLAE